MTVLAGDETRPAGFDEFLVAAVGKKTLPLDHGLFGIEVAGGGRLEDVPRPGLENRSR
ncbi:hypothetical protein ACIBM4_04535 [Streptomyces sp. NPDC050256]|uniref:hypothetical protein n=1 Tax=unclassified Streptomyces TaxID=2593676 RepID=UPI003787BBA0